MLRLILVAAVVSLVTAEPQPDWLDSLLGLKNYRSTQEDAQYILGRFDPEYKKYLNNLAHAEWNYFTNMTDENQAARENAAKIPDLITQIATEANALSKADLDLQDEHIKRQFKMLIKKFVKVPINESSVHGFSFEELESSILQMAKIYNTARICDFTNKTKCDLAVKEVKEIMEHSRDPEELKYIWLEWRKASGERIKSLYPKYVEYVNIEARRKNFPDQAAYGISDYEADDFPEQIDTLWHQLKPLYLQLHAYVRRELREKYGEDIISKDGPIPAHLSTLWKIAHFTIPFPDKQLPDVTKTLIEQGYNATSIFRLAENFFKSINLSAMPDTFWEKSILEQQKDVDMSCTPRAWDFSDGRDFRISQCTRVNMKNLVTAHHEMAYVEYFMQFKDQPPLFKEFANPSFHEAIAELILLSLSTFGYFKKIGLLEKDSIDQEALLNLLYVNNFETIARLPVDYMMDRWRWDVFEGRVTPDNYNCHWWSLAAEYQGIEPPVDRSEEDFDPGAIYSIITNTEHIHNFLRYVIQFQFHKALCIEAKQYDPNNSSVNPLHKCDIYGNKNVGNLLKSMMELGSSKPWPDAMEKITGQRKIDAAALLEYFQPLMDWLTEKNKKTNEYIGWKPSNKGCVKTKEKFTEIDRKLVKTKEELTQLDSELQIYFEKSRSK